VKRSGGCGGIISPCGKAKRDNREKLSTGRIAFKAILKAKKGESFSKFDRKFI
jgi:hypothetical protein